MMLILSPKVRGAAFYALTQEGGGGCGQYSTGGEYAGVTSMDPIGLSADASSSTVSCLGGFVGLQVDASTLNCGLKPAAIVGGTSRSLVVEVVLNDGTTARLTPSDFQVTQIQGPLTWDAVAGTLGASLVAADTGAGATVLWANYNAPIVLQVLALEASYAAWQLVRFTAGDAGLPPSADPTADPDGDGMPNLLEYSVNGNPRVADAGAYAVRVEVAGDFLTLTFYRVARNDLRQRVEASDDLQSWQSIWEADSTSTGWLTIADVKSVSGTKTRFMRLVTEIK